MIQMSPADNLILLRAPVASGPPVERLLGVRHWGTGPYRGGPHGCVLRCNHRGSFILVWLWQQQLGVMKTQKEVQL